MHNLMSWKLDTNKFLMACGLPSNLRRIDYSFTFEFETEIRTYRENFRLC